jgi:hypothetical protein
MRSQTAFDVIPLDVSGGNQALAQEICAIRATGAGNVKVRTRAGVDRVLAFAAGETREVYTKLIIQIGTTATGLEGIVPQN